MMSSAPHGDNQARSTGVVNLVKIAGGTGCPSQLVRAGYRQCHGSVNAADWGTTRLSESTVAALVNTKEKTNELYALAEDVREKEGVSARCDGRCGGSDFAGYI